MPVPFWQPGTLYQPGATVQANVTPPVSASEPDNPGFEDGDTGWVSTSDGWSIVASPSAFQGDDIAVFGVPTAILAANRGSGSVDEKFMRSLDNGETWEFVADPVSTFTGSYGARPERLAGNATVRQWTTTDGGGTWSSQVVSATIVPAVMKWYAPGGFWIGFVSAANGAPMIYRSDDDCASWSAVHTNTTGSARNVVAFDYDPVSGQLVALDSTSGWCFTSADGVTWAENNSGTKTNHTVMQWFPDAGLFMAIGSNGNYETSPTGAVWTSRSDVAVANPAGMAYSPVLQRVALVGQVTAGTQVYASYTDDGVNWNDKAIGLDYPMFRVLWSNSAQAFIALGSTLGTGNPDEALISTDGATYVKQGDLPIVGIWSNFLQLEFAPSTDPFINTNVVPVSAGQTVRARARVRSAADSGGRVGIVWYGVSDEVLSIDYADAYVEGESSVWRLSEVEANAPVDAIGMTVALAAFAAEGEVVAFDNVEWDYAYQELATCLIFRATQAAAGFSGNNEPEWPTALGYDVIDNEVVWEGVSANRVVWRAFPILQSGDTEPTWPDAVGGEVPDNTISWQAVSQRVEDENCPNTKEVAIAASKIFAGDGDIIAYSATVNPLDWTTTDDAGYLPFGLQTYGSQPVSALGLYRSNLVAFNAEGFQMWQVDEDPQNMALLDAVAVPCEYYRTPVPVMNDLVFLTREGIRSMGIAGASTNLQAGSFGKQIDPLVLEAIAGGEIPNALYFPGAGQYWCIFGAEAFVLTVNGGKNDMSWSRYVFPSSIDYWTILGDDLILRSGNKIWRISDEATLDDQVGEYGEDFTGELWWPYLDMGMIGVEKMFIGFDLVGEGEVSVSIAYDQTNLASVTTPYTIDADTVPGKLIPLPVSAPSFQVRLTFSANQTWEWQATTAYVNDMRAGS